MVMLKQNLKLETLKKKTSSRTTPYASTWNLIIEHIVATRQWHLHLKLEQQSLDQHRRSEIEDRFDQIRSELATPTERERAQCMQRQSDQRLQRLKVFYTLRLCSLSFSLLIFEFCCGLWCELWSETERERKCSLSFWTDSLSLSLYNYSIYLPMIFFFFDFIRWYVTMLLNWCWWVCLLVYCDLWLAVKKQQFICPPFFFTLSVGVCTHEVCASVC